MKSLRLALLLSCVTCLTPAGAPAAAETAEPRALTLENGLRVLLAPDPRASAVDVSVWYEAGVRYERPPALGISHLFEHLSGRGVAPGGNDELRRRIEAEGGASGAFTSADFTCFTHTVPRGALATVLQLEAGRLTLKPTQAMLDLERAQVRDETRARARANPLERGIQRLYATAFPSHPYRWAVLGSDDDLRRLTLGQCQEFLQHRYTPDHVLVTIVGDFDPDVAVRELRKGLGAVRRRGDNQAPPPEPEPRGARRAVEVGDVQSPVVIVGWRVPAGSAGDGAALDLLAALLSKGSNARLNQWPPNMEPALLFAQSGRDTRHDATIFWAAAAGRSVADTSVVESHVIGQVEKLAAEPVSGEELDRARRQVEVSLLFGRQTAHDRAVALGTAEMMTGDWHDADAILERVRALTPADLQQAAARTLVAARRTVVWMLPASSGGSVGGRP